LDNYVQNDVVERMRGSHVELDQEEVLMIEVGHHQVEVLRALKVEEGLLVLPEVELSFVEAYLLEVRHELEEGLQEACPEELRPLVEDRRRTLALEVARVKLVEDLLVVDLL